MQSLPCKVALLSILLAFCVNSQGLPFYFDPFGNLGGSSFNPLQLNPVAWYKADGNALDSVGGFNGTWIGTPTYTNGINGQAFSLEPNRYIPAGNVLVYNEMTICAWVRSRGAWKTTSNNGNYICSKFSLSSEGSYIFRVFVDKKLNIVVNTSSGVTIINSSSTVPESEWVFVSFTIKSGDSYVSINGQTLGTSTNTFASVNVTADAFTIGGRGDYPETYSATMDIDNVLVFNRALTQAEITQLYNWRQ